MLGGNNEDFSLEVLWSLWSLLKSLLLKSPEVSWSPIEVSWSFLKSSEVSWSLPKFLEVFRSSMKSHEVFWGLMKFFEVCRKFEVSVLEVFCSLLKFWSLEVRCFPLGFMLQRFSRISIVFKHCTGKRKIQWQLHIQVDVLDQ
jgi:hypothetical protein